MRRKKNKQMEGQMSIFDMFSSVIENTKTEEENVTVSEGGIAAADITAVETGTQTSIFDLFSTDEQDTQKQEKKPKKNFFHRTIQFAKSLEDKWKNNLAALKCYLGWTIMLMKISKPSCQVMKDGVDCLHISKWRKRKYS